MCKLHILLTNFTANKQAYNTTRTVPWPMLSIFHVNFDYKSMVPFLNPKFGMRLVQKGNPYLSKMAGFY